MLTCVLNLCVDPVAKGGYQQWINLLKSIDMPELEAHLTTGPATSLSATVPALYKLVLCNLLSPPFMPLITQDQFKTVLNTGGTSLDAPQQAVTALKSVPVVSAVALRMYCRGGALAVLQVRALCSGSLCHVPHKATTVASDVCKYSVLMSRPMPCPPDAT